jgi:hypothetical protein
MKMIIKIALIVVLGYAIFSLLKEHFECEKEFH